MMTLDYGEYVTRYCGTLDENAFRQLRRPAAAYLYAVTGGKADDSEACKTALCQIMELMSEDDRRRVKQEANDGVSVTYREDTEPLSARMYRAVSICLTGTGMLYRGL